MLSDDEFRILLQDLDRPWDGYRKVRKGVKKRIRRHMEQVGCRTVEDYVRLMKTHPEVKAECDRSFFVTISRFFRDRALWQDLKERFLPSLLLNFEGPLRVWSAGCASGEESYSIAMLFHLIGQSSRLSLLASDAQAVCLDRARNGSFGRSSLKEVSDDLRNHFFASQKGGRCFRIKLDTIAPIQWRQHHLLVDAPPSGPFHLIFLRNNILTYHKGRELESALNRILSVLVHGGYLVVGSHEKLPHPSFPLRRDTHCPWVYFRE